MEWRFKKLTPDDVLQNAAHLAFFHDDALNSAVNALAREDIQNSLDAVGRNEPCVKIRYRLCGPATLSQQNRWFHGLQSHLDAPQVREELGDVPTLAGKIRWLVIEDFGTTGLEGDPLAHKDPVGGTGQRNDFFWFIRNVARSGKMGGDRGRWGLGKIVYPASSQIRSFFAYSVRRSDKKRLLIGRSVLKVHSIDEDNYHAEGFYGNFDDPDHKYFATPAIDAATLDQFVADFYLTRRPDEPGLSLAIPIPEEDIDPKSIILSVIEHWFWVILEGRLIVEVALSDADEPVRLAYDTLEKAIRQHLRDGSRQMQQLLRKLQFATEIQSYDLNDLIELNECPPGKPPSWTAPEERFRSTQDLEKARLVFAEGKLLGFGIPVRVTRKGESKDHQGSFEVWLRKTDSPDPAVETFLRAGLTISGQQYLRERGIIALVKAGDMPNEPLGTLLGDAENPAHTRWVSNLPHFKDRYQYGASILSYVKRSAEHLCSVLSRQPAGIDKTLLQEFFSLPLITNAPPHPGPRPPVGPKPEGKTVLPPLIIDLKPRKYYVECREVKGGGFLVQPHEKAEKTPFAIQVRAAYEVVRGDPFKEYDPLDFNFVEETDCSLELKGLSILSRTPNSLVLKVEDPQFELKALGFDARRDLIVKVRPVHDFAKQPSEPETV